MPPTYEEAFNATNPDAPEDQRDEAARRILAGAAANEAYWNSRTELEALRARAEGHGVIVRGSNTQEGSPTVVGADTLPAIESTAVEEPNAAPTATPAPSPDNETEAVARLRKQLQDAGITPEV